MTKAQVRNTAGVGHNHFLLMRHSRQTPKNHNSKPAKSTKKGARDNGKKENGEKDETSKWRVKKLVSRKSRFKIIQKSPKTYKCIL